LSIHMSVIQSPLDGKRLCPKFSGHTRTRSDGERTMFRWWACTAL
jgi:hypothetical protein